jgi:hypothetical protein
MIAGRYELGEIGSEAVGGGRRMGKRWRRKLVLSREPRVGKRKDICSRAVSELCQVTDGQGSSTTKADS